MRTGSSTETIDIVGSCVVEPSSIFARAIVGGWIAGSFATRQDMPLHTCVVRTVDRCRPSRRYLPCQQSDLFRPSRRSRLFHPFRLCLPSTGAGSIGRRFGDEAPFATPASRAGVGPSGRVAELCGRTIVRHVGLTSLV
jgi:hypothetical protein